MEENQRDETLDQPENGGQPNEQPGGDNDQENNVESRIAELEAELEKERSIKAEVIQSRDEWKKKAKGQNKKPETKDEPKNSQKDDEIASLKDLIYRNDKATHESAFERVYNTLPDEFKKIVDDETSDKDLFGEKLTVAKRYASALEKHGLIKEKAPAGGMPRTPNTKDVGGNRNHLDDEAKRLLKSDPFMTEEQAIKRAAILKKKRKQFSKN